MDFDMLGLSPRLLARLSDLGIKAPTPIQTRAIPHALNGRDVLGIAQTGTGKTLAFGLPLLNALQGVGSKPAPKTARGLILAPTRELARQISDSLRAYTEGSHLKVQVVVGGAAINPQIKRLERGTDLLVATPGRLIDLLDRGAVSLAQSRFLVLDEADQMLDLGFIHALRKIAPLLSEDRQTMLFSATMPKQMEELSKAYLNDAVRVEASPPGKAADKITQSVHFVAKDDKTDLLIRHLKEHKGDRALVFVGMKYAADRLAKHLDRAGFEVAAIHGNRSQGQRERAINAFRSGAVKVLVATDVAARGIDIPDVRHVYNYDLPNVTENYVHRIGRTARAGADGAAVAYCAAEDMGTLRDIQRLMKLDIPVASGEPWETEPQKKPGRNGNRRPRNNPNPGSKPSRRPRRRKRAA